MKGVRSHRFSVGDKVFISQASGYLLKDNQRKGIIIGIISNGVYDVEVGKYGSSLAVPEDFLIKRRKDREVRKFKVYLLGIPLFTIKEAD